MEINGKFYPLWGQFVGRKNEWIGGVLIDDDEGMSTEIIDIELKPNGVDSAFFSVVGKDFSCGFDVRVGGISGSQKPREGLLSFSSPSGRWSISKKLLSYQSPVRMP